MAGSSGKPNRNRNAQLSKPSATNVPVSTYGPTTSVMQGVLNSRRPPQQPQQRKSARLPVRPSNSGSAGKGQKSHCQPKREKREEPPLTPAPIPVKTVRKDPGLPVKKTKRSVRNRERVVPPPESKIIKPKMPSSLNEHPHSSDMDNESLLKRKPPPKASVLKILPKMTLPTGPSVVPINTTAPSTPPPATSEEEDTLHSMDTEMPELALPNYQTADDEFEDPAPLGNDGAPKSNP